MRGGLKAAVAELAILLARTIGGRAYTAFVSDLGKLPG